MKWNEKALAAAAQLCVESSVFSLFSLCSRSSRTFYFLAARRSIEAKIIFIFTLRATMYSSSTHPSIERRTTKRRKKKEKKEANKIRNEINEMTWHNLCQFCFIFFFFVMFTHSPPWMAELAIGNGNFRHRHHHHHRRRRCRCRRAWTKKETNRIRVEQVAYCVYYFYRLQSIDTQVTSANGGRVQKRTRSREPTTTKIKK